MYLKVMVQLVAVTLNVDVTHRLGSLEHLGREARSESGQRR